MQERFRAVTKSYFRRADGVMLLYDVTSERSFVAVREWIEAVDVSYYTSRLSFANFFIIWSKHMSQINLALFNTVTTTGGRRETSTDNALRQ